MTSSEKVESGPNAEIKAGNCLPLRNIPLGTNVHNLELVPGRRSRIARAAGSFCQLMAKEGDYAQLRLPSGEVRKFHMNCSATTSTTRASSSAGGWPNSASNTK